jgi:tetratricopeptide (TPR) repeat protein
MDKQTSQAQSPATDTAFSRWRDILERWRTAAGNRWLALRTGEWKGRSGARRGSEGDPGRRAFINTTRRFAVFMAAMLGLLFICIWVLLSIWRQADREIQSSAVYSESPPPSLWRREAAQSTAGINAPVKEAPARTAKALDMDSISRAIFLARGAMAREQAGDFQGAIGGYVEALDVWPRQADVWARLGGAYLKIKEYAKARAALEMAVENNPSSAVVLNDLGVAFLYTGQTDQAQRAFEAAQIADPRFAASFFNLALCQLARGDRVSARNFFNRYLHIRPDDPRALREVAFLDAAAQNYTEALARLEKAMVAAPDWPLLYFDAAATAALMGRTDDVFDYLERAEPLSSIGAVYQLYQQPAFKQIRDTELGREYEKGLALRARKFLESGAAPEAAPTSSEPLSSASSNL